MSRLVLILLICFVLLTGFVLTSFQAAQISTQRPRGANPRNVDAKAFPVVVKGTTYYVNNRDPKASDSNDGKNATYDEKSGSGPWKTIAKSAAAMAAGDGTIILPGSYRETEIRFARSGESGAPIQLVANRSAGEVILDGRDHEQAVGIRLASGQSHFVIAGLTIRNMATAGVATEQDPTQVCSDIVLRDLRLRNCGDGVKLVAVHGFRLQSIRTHKNEGDGIRLQGSTRHRLRGGTITDCHSYDNGGNGLTILRGEKIEIANSMFVANGNNGVQLGDEENKANAVSRATIQSSVAHDNMADGLLLAGGCSLNALIDNEVYKNRRLGILLMDCTENSVRKNHVYGNTDEGVVLQRSSNNAVSNNRAHHHGVNGFAVIKSSSNNRFVGNESHSNGMRGFLVAENPRKNTFRRNNSHHNMILGFGVYDQARDNLFDHNDVHHNIYHGFALLHDAHANTFVANRIHDNSACGVYFETSRDNKFEDNEPYNNKLDGFAVLYESTGNVFHNNSAHDNKARGFLSDLSSVDFDWSKTNKAQKNSKGGFAKIDRDRIANLRAYTK